MNWLNNLDVPKKLALLIWVFLIGLVCVGSTGYYYLNKTNKAMDTMYQEKLISVELLMESGLHAKSVESNIFRLMIATDDAENKSIDAELKKEAVLFDQNLTAYEKMPLSGKESSEVKEVREILKKYRDERAKVLELAMQNKNQEAYTLYMKSVRPEAVKFTEKLQLLTEETKQAAEKMNAESQASFALANTLFIGIILISMLLGGILGWLITRRLRKRFDDLLRYLSILSKGDFSQDVSAASMADKSEFGTVSRAFDVMAKNVRQLITQLANTSEQLASSSEEMTASAEQSAQASSQVADTVASVAEGAESQLRLANTADQIVRQIASAIDQVSQNTQTVSAAAAQTANTAETGESAVHQAVSQMKVIEEKTNSTAKVIGELEEKSNQIGQIVDVISNISGQTNLLALNAAIEAARAGEAGRGFAVVAEEVRKLAEQSQDAAKQITELIGDVQGRTNRAVSFMQDNEKEVKTGASVVSDAGQSFVEILSMVQNMTKQIQEISGAIEEVTAGTKNVVRSVQDIDHESKRTAEKTQTISAATEEQSASVEEIASASRHLAVMAEELQHAIHTFKY